MLVTSRVPQVPIRRKREALEFQFCFGGRALQVSFTLLSNSAHRFAGRSDKMEYLPGPVNKLESSGGFVPRGH